MMRFHRLLVITCFMTKTAVILYLAFFGFIILIVGLHVGFGVCPFYFSTFKQSETIPVVYGLPATEGLNEGLKGRSYLWWVYDWAHQGRSSLL